MERAIINNDFFNHLHFCMLWLKSVFTFARLKRRTLMVVCVDTYMDVFRFIIL